MDHTRPEVTGGDQDSWLKRRRFLKMVSAAGGTLVAALIGIPVVSAFLTPAFKRRVSKGWIKVAQADDVDIDNPVKVEFVESANDAWVQTRKLRTVWLRTEDGESFSAFSGTCTHLGCSVFFDAKRNAFVCPCHRGVFDFKTGAVLDGPPPRGLDPLPVRVVAGRVEVMLKQFRAGVPERIEI
jgi:menaquinol-cytochrome c reductase iron-sulfur subunit